MSSTREVPSPDLATRSRAVTKPNLYAVLPKRNRVVSRVPRFEETEVEVLATPQLGARFVQHELIIREAGGTREPYEDDLEQFLYVLEGQLDLQVGGKENHLASGGFAWLPPNTVVEMRCSGKEVCRALWHRRRYVSVEGVAIPKPLVSNEKKVKSLPEDTYMEQHLIPYDEDLGYDMAFNLLRFEPGVHFGFVESHINEHGLYMLSGRGVYWLNGDYHEVTADDFIYMAPYCPQFFYATGWEDGSYLLYKDVNRDYTEGV